MRRLGMWVGGALLLSAPLVVQAQDSVGFRGWGPRMGASVNPDQVVFGVHLDYGHFARHIRVQPNVEVGLGDDRSVISFDGDLAYQFNADWGRWSPYVGGGLNLIVISHDRPGRDDESQTDLGVSALGGIQKTLVGGDRFFLEVKLGLVDAPDLKLLVGWTFFSRGR